MWEFRSFSALDLVEQVFPILFLVIFCVILAALVRGVAEWNKNNHSPRLTAPARVASRRASTSHHVAGLIGGSEHISTYYYVTFEFDSGDQQEFSVPGQEYGLLSEGDVGLLTFQGTRYLGFERH